jgi:hypothetical protein
MTVVEHRNRREYPSFVWAKDIRVNVGTEELEVSGIIPVLQEDLDAAPDPLRAYRQAVSRFGGPKRQGKNSPHIEFANANNDQKLIRFVQQFGPLVVSSSHTEERESGSEGAFGFQISQTVLVAHQNLAELRSEHLAYRSALALVSELQRGKRTNIATIRGCVPEIVEHVKRWPQQWERERLLRASGQEYAPEPQWLFRQLNLEYLLQFRYQATCESSGDRLSDLLRGADPVRAGHKVICELVNAFNPLVYPWGNTPVEAPGLDLTGGIRPVLYYMLRREYLHAGGIGICRNTECRDLFEIERSGSEFCGDVCSRLQRQREYWRNRGKKMRKRRLKTGDRRATIVSGNPTEPHEKRKERKP